MSPRNAVLMPAGGGDHAAATALVTGATGVIGPELVTALLAVGHRVRVLVRRPPAAGVLPAEVEVVRGDITDPAAARAAVADVRFVFHLAAKLHITNPAPELAGEYRATNVEGTRIVAEAARSAGAERFIFFSTIAVYEPTTCGEVLDEDSPATARSLYGATKREAEEVVLALRREDGAPWGVVLRIAGVYGPRIRGNYRQLAHWLRRGLFLPVGPGTNRRTLVHDRDVAAAALLAAVHPSAGGRIFNVTDGEVHTLREVVDTMCLVMNKARPRLHVPLSVARTCAVAIDRGVALAGRKGFVAPLVDKMVEDMAVSGQRIQDELGFVPRYDLLTGWSDTIPRLIDGADGAQPFL